VTQYNLNDTPGIYRSRNQGLSAVLTLHGLTHLRTYQTPVGVTYEFSDPHNEARAIAKKYHNETHTGGFPCRDSKALVEAFLNIRKTLTFAIQNGAWNQPGLQQPDPEQVSR
jgi:hypothetical protein